MIMDKLALDVLATSLGILKEGTFGGIHKELINLTLEYKDGVNGIVATYREVVDPPLILKNCRCTLTPTLKDQDNAPLRPK